MTPQQCRHQRDNTRIYTSINTDEKSTKLRKARDQQTHSQTQRHRHTNTHEHTRTHEHTHERAHTRTHTHERTRTHPHTNAHERTRTHPHMNAHERTHERTHTNAHTQTHKQTNTQAPTYALKDALTDALTTWKNNYMQHHHEFRTVVMRRAVLFCSRHLYGLSTLIALSWHDFFMPEPFTVGGVDLFPNMRSRYFLIIFHIFDRHRIIVFICDTQHRL